MLLLLQGGLMLGGIAGDIIGSRFEHAQIKTKDFELFGRQCTFTDDTVHTVAVADSLLHKTPYQVNFLRYFQYYPNAGYGNRFRRWARSTRPVPYGSYGNGSAMRVSPIAWFYDSLDKVLEEALHSAEVTHNHPEGIKGAQAVAGTIYLARTGASKQEVREFVEGSFGYDLSGTVAAIRADYGFDVTCQGSVPQAMVAFLEAEDYEDAVRNAVSLGGDSDTLACIAGSIAEAYFGGVPEGILASASIKLDKEILKVVDKFLCYLPFEYKI
jgi:ADP-ribosylglycohydrolase